MTTWKHFCLSRQFPLRFPRCFFSPSHPFTYCYFLGVSTASHSPQLVSVTAQLWGTSLFFISSSAVFLKFITEVFFFLLAIFGFLLTVKILNVSLTHAAYLSPCSEMVSYGSSHPLESKLPEVRNCIFCVHSSIPRAYKWQVEKRGTRLLFLMNFYWR